MSPSALAKVIVLLVLLVATGAALGGSQLGPAWAGHQQFNPTWVWRNYASTWSPPRVVEWRSCNGTTYYDNLTGVALNNWAARFGHGVTHWKLANGCNHDYDPNYAIFYTTAEVVDEYCSGNFCFEPYSCLNSSGQLVYCESSGVKRVLLARLYVDKEVFDQLIWNTGQQLHILAHEFGHGMGLKDFSHACGAGSVMSGGACMDLVNGGQVVATPSPPRNDVCTPDTVLGWGTTRC